MQSLKGQHYKIFTNRLTLFNTYYITSKPTFLVKSVGERSLNDVSSNISR